jgi:hypothetical protein
MEVTGMGQREGRKQAKCGSKVFAVMKKRGVFEHAHHMIQKHRICQAGIEKNHALWKGHGQITISNRKPNQLYL